MQNTKKITIIALFTIFGMIVAYTGFLLYWQKNLSPSADDVLESPAPIESTEPETSPPPEEVSPPPLDVSPTPVEESPTPPASSSRRRTPTPTPTPMPTPATQSQEEAESYAQSEAVATTEEEVTSYENTQESVTRSTPSPAITASAQPVKSPIVTSNHLSKLDLPIAPQDMPVKETIGVAVSILPNYIYFIYILIPVILTLGLFIYIKKYRQ